MTWIDGDAITTGTAYEPEREKDFYEKRLGPIDDEHWIPGQGEGKQRKCKQCGKSFLSFRNAKICSYECRDQRQRDTVNRAAEIKRRRRENAKNEKDLRKPSSL